MIISQPASFLSEIVSGAPIPPEKLGYFRGRLSNRFHEVVLELFDELERAGKITRAALARRIGKAPEQVTRWLGAPGNWTLDTISDLFLGMGYEPIISAEALAVQEEAAAITWDDLPDDPPVLEISYAATNIEMQTLLFDYNTMAPLNTGAFFYDPISSSRGYWIQNFGVISGISRQWNQTTINAQAFPQLTVNQAICLTFEDTDNTAEEAAMEKLWRWNKFGQIGTQQRQRAASFEGSLQ